MRIFKHRFLTKSIKPSINYQSWKINFKYKSKKTWHFMGLQEKTRIFLRRLTTKKSLENNFINHLTRPSIPTFNLLNNHLSTKPLPNYGNPLMKKSQISQQSFSKFCHQSRKINKINRSKFSKSQKLSQQRRV